MALLFLKSLVFPRPTTLYTLLPKDRDSRESSIDSSSTSSTTPSSPNLLSEKEQSGSTATQLTRRIDPRLISDATIGLSDGLTVPFALTAGLSALGDTKVVIYGGLAELIAGGISMGLGGYLGARSEAQGYEAAQSETRKMVADDTYRATELVRECLSSYDISSNVLDGFTRDLSASALNLEHFLMRFHHELPESACTRARAYASALTIAAGYFFGGLVPLLPYFVAGTNQIAFRWSVAVMAVALFVFGYVKTMLVGEGSKTRCFRAGIEMVFLGGIAAAAAMGSVKAIAGE